MATKKKDQTEGGVEEEGGGNQDGKTQDQEAKSLEGNGKKLFVCKTTFFDNKSCVYYTEGDVVCPPSGVVLPDYFQEQ